MYFCQTSVVTRLLFDRLVVALLLIVYVHILIPPLVVL